jgi:hypothetical protein
MYFSINNLHTSNDYLSTLDLNSNLKHDHSATDYTTIPPTSESFQTDWIFQSVITLEVGSSGSYLTVISGLFWDREFGWIYVYKPASHSSIIIGKTKSGRNCIFCTFVSLCISHSYT